jgi:hypothetical protein
VPDARAGLTGPEQLARIPFSFCPRCGGQLEDPRSFVQEYWVADETIYRCWCRRCAFGWDLKVVERVVSHESET